VSEQAKASKASDRPEKNLLMIPARVALALQDDGWILRNAIIWHKPNAMPESVRDRMSNRYEHLFLLAKQPRYWFDLDAIREPHTAASIASSERRARARSTYREGVGGQKGHSLTSSVSLRGANPGDVWQIATRPYTDAHFSVFPIDLPLRCIKAGCRPDGTVLDLFSGSGTTGAAARMLGRRYIGIDLRAEYHELAKQRFAQGVLDPDLGGDVA
jgi:DNA modification methylase